MQRLLLVLTDLYDWWNRATFSVKIASVYILLLCAIFYLLGSYRNPADYRQLENQVTEARQETRQFANELARRNDELNSLRIREKLNEKTIELLGDKIDLLENHSIQWQEETAFYRRVLEKENTDAEVIIHALTVNPDFTRQGWKLSAILARPGKQKTFKGGYFFEIIETSPGGKHSLTRLPTEGETAFSMDIYYEIQELVNLSANKTIENLRLIIIDEKNNRVAEAEMISSPDNSNSNGAGANGSTTAVNPPQ